ncbi:MAG: STAS/SEC14 domain-containing protein [Myxococcota bacterium]
MGEEEASGIQLLDEDDATDGLLAYAMEAGDVSDEALAPIWRRFDDAKAAGTKVRVYAEMRGIPSVHASMILDKLKRLGTILGTVERMAIVGDAGWLELYAKLVDPITKPDIRHFATSNKDGALAWLRE